MQRGVLLATGAAVLIVGGVVGVRAFTHRQAGRVLDQNIDQLLAQAPPGTTVRHGAVDYNPLTGAATVHDLAVSQADGTTWTAATVTVSGADGAALHDVFDPGAYPQGLPAWTDRRALVSEASASNVHVSVPAPHAAAITIANARLRGLSGHPFALAPTPENRAKPAFAAGAALALAFEDATLTGIAVADPSPSASPAKLTLASLSTEGYGSGKARSVAIRTMQAEVVASPGKAPLRFRLDGMQVSDADATSLLQAVLGQAAGGPAPRLSYAAWDVTGAGMEVPQGPAVSMHDLHATMEAAGAAPHGKAVMTGLTLALGETPVPASAAPALAAFGMNAITTDVTATTQGRPPGPFTVHEDLVMRELGTLHVDGTVEGYTAPQAVSGDPTAALAALTAASLNHATLVWDDASLTDRALRVAAQQEHATPDQVRAQLAMPILALGVMVPDQPDAADQVTRFVNHPHRLTLTINPPQKVSLGEVAAAPATERAHLLGLRVAAE